MKNITMITLILFPTVIVPREIDSSHSYSDAYKMASKAFVALPEIKEITKRVTKKGYTVIENNTGLTKYDLGYIVGVSGTLIKGEISTKAFKNFRYKSNKGFTITPNVVYDISEREFNSNVVFRFDF